MITKLPDIVSSDFCNRAEDTVDIERRLTMKKNFKRLATFLFACIMCLSLGTVAFATESDITETSNTEITAVGASATPRTIGDRLYSKSTYFEGDDCTIVLVTSSSNVDADFVLEVSGNSGANYLVTMYAPSGASSSQIIGGDGGRAQFNMALAPAGTYTFTFVKNSGTTAPAIATASIYD